MISLYDGQITDLLPWKIAQSTEVRCISYAVAAGTPEDAPAGSAYQNYGSH